MAVSNNFEIWALGYAGGDIGDLSLPAVCFTMNLSLFTPLVMAMAVWGAYGKP